MGKVYPFPNKKNTNPYRQANYSPNMALLREFMDTLVLTYEDKIDELKGYKEKIKKLDGLALKSPKEVSKEVKRLKQLFLELSPRGACSLVKNKVNYPQIFRINNCAIYWKGVALCLQKTSRLIDEML